MPRETKRPVRPPTWDAKCGAIEGAFRKLPIAIASDPDSLTYADLIPDIAQQLMRMSLVQLAPRYARKAASAGTAEQELRDLSVRAKALGNVIARMSKNAHDALTTPNDQVPTLRPDALQRLRATLRDLLGCAHLAVIFATVPEQDGGTGKGRPPKEQADGIADVVAVHYFRLTGMEPSLSVREGGFIQLLQTVFAVLGVRASVEWQAKRLSKGGV